MKEKKITLKSMREDPRYTSSLLLKGNGKLLDYTDDDGNVFRYAQVNTRAVKDCPFRSEGCEAVCYATKGNHVFPEVKASRERSYMETKREDFADAMLYTIGVEKQSKRYSNCTMIIRIHESGDFYSLQYLRKWIRIWAALLTDKTTICVFYTKSFPFFLKLTDDEKAVINAALAAGTLSINLSMDDTFTSAQRLAYLEMIKTFPKANTYYCTEHVEDVKHDDVCDCADCAKCGTCNKAQGKTTVVKIHSASNADMDVYRKNIRK